MKTIALIVVSIVACATSAAGRASVCEAGYLPSNPDTAYTLDPDGTATDLRTGLTWKRCVEGFVWNGTACTGSASFHNWEQSLVLAEATTFDGQGDWRLPNVKELRSLAEECRMDPAVNVTVFPSTPTALNDQFAFWSSSPHATSVDQSYYIRSGRGDTGSGARTVVRLVRLVRGGGTPAP